MDNSKNNNYNFKIKKKECFDYYEKVLVMQIKDKLVEQGVILKELPEKSDDIVVGDDAILKSNVYVYGFTRYIKKNIEFYNLTLASKLYGESFLDEICNYVVQKFLCMVIDYLESGREDLVYRMGKYNMDMELKIDPNELKKINFSEMAKECDEYLYRFDFRFKLKHKDAPRALDILSVKLENGLPYEDGDSDHYYYYTNEEKKKISNCIIKLWFVDLLCDDYY
ncbi:hypothetical protein NGRA_0557 [Nosema granulosis]|uniref:Uncharacterized protein n=1 Tax=Nosema granulosis TaxID=83296 RepID=A0A9P6H040_9MICR|nr:hypothetical protein NGRA_0557 [Nosema granulosis]